MAINRNKYYRIVNLIEFAHKISPELSGRTLAYYYDKKIDESILLNDLNCIYMPVPKAGTKSIKKAFAEYLFSTKSDQRFNTDQVNTKGLPFDKVSKTEAEKLRDKYFIFSFIRNPFKRVLSCYFDKIRKETSYMGFLRYKNQFYRQMSFEEFIIKISDIPDSDADQHFRSQYIFLTGSKRKLIPHFTGKLEQIEEDFAKIVNRLKCKDLKLKHINKSEVKKSFQEEYFTPKIIDMIIDRYQTDFEMFGYKPNIGNL